VEKFYDSLLRGQAGGFQVEVNPSGVQRRIMRYRAPVSGKTIKLSVDFEVQKLAEDLLGAEAGAIVVCNPKNGEVLALASQPGYDPNLFVGGISVKNWNKLLKDELKPMQNRCLQGQYPPGSVFKIVTALAALKDGLINPDRLFLCRGIYWYKTWPYRCWKTFGHGWMNLHNALVGSCDIFFYQVGLELTVDRIYRAARAFGLGSRTHIDLDSEMAGLVPNAKWKEATQHMPWFPGNTIQMSIGQGYVLTTPLQMLSVTCAMANRGRIYQPHLLYQVLDETTGQPRQAYRPNVMLETGFDPEHLDRVRASLEQVVGALGGTGKKARVTGLKIAGKTGTSENPHGENHAWFTAYAPADDPQVAVIILVENGGEGGLVAAPIAKRLIEASLGREVTPWANPTPVPEEYDGEATTPEPSVGARNP
jgi:penicillin-binding protein 2